MIACRPYISFPLIKLSQYSKNLASDHFCIVKQIFKYLKLTAEDGICYWRTHPQMDLPILQIPVYKPDTHNHNNSAHDSSSHLHAAIDSDWEGDSVHQKSTTGLTLHLASGTILYKTWFQDCIALSSTEAKFTAACNVGKTIL